MFQKQTSLAIKIFGYLECLKILALEHFSFYEWEITDRFSLSDTMQQRKLQYSDHVMKCRHVG